MNKSGTYILPAAFKGKGVIVTMGGFVDEPMPMGIAAGGVGTDASQWALFAAQLRSWQVPVDFEYVQFERQVESQMEMWATNRKDRTTLNADNPVKPDLRLHVWSDSSETDGYVYGRLLKSVDAAARRRGLVGSFATFTETSNGLFAIYFLLLHIETAMQTIGRTIDANDGFGINRR